MNGEEEKAKQSEVETKSKTVKAKVVCTMADLGRDLKIKLITGADVVELESKKAKALQHLEFVKIL